jgi:hypothetical protein
MNRCVATPRNDSHLQNSIPARGLLKLAWLRDSDFLEPLYCCSIDASIQGYTPLEIGIKARTIPLAGCSLFSFILTVK